MPLGKLATLIATILTLVYAQFSYSAPGDIITSFAINNITSDGRVPTTPHGITFHDGYVWVVDFGTDRIYRVYPEDIYDTDEVTLLFSAGDSDFNIPITDTDTPPINSDGNPIGFCGADSGTQYCGGGGLTFAENFLWNASPVTDDIIKIDPVDGDNLETENALASLAFPAPTDITHDGTNFWISDWQSNIISKVRPEDGLDLGNIPGPTPTSNIYGLTWDGQALWVADRADNTIYRVSHTDGSLLNFFATPGTNPRGLSWDGESLWHVDASTGLIYRLESGVIPFGITGCMEKNGRGLNGDVLLAQTATMDQSTTTDVDGCFHFASFVSGVPLQVGISESGVDEKPVITLTGGDVTLIVGDTYLEPGYTATDTEDGDITADVVATPDVINAPTIIDTSVPNPTGIVVSYDVVDSAGNAAYTATRTVFVLEVDTTAPVITLIGDNPTYVEQASSYTELGATAIDDRDGDISANIAVTGSVNTAIAGTYTISYDVSDSTGNVATTVTRDVIVQDTIIPVITLTGTNPITHERGDTFTDPGATATDNIDGDITGNITISGSVSANVTGSYVLTYDVSDTAGNSATTVTRTINVIDSTIPTITLIGSNPFNQELNTTFTDPGATASDYPGDNLSASIVVTGTVNTTLAGTYTLTYDVTDIAGNVATSVTRDVVVADTGAPIITLLGNNPLEHERGTVYTDPGATASDTIDGDITANIVVGGATVDINTAGSYVVTYDVNDSVGNPAVQVTRTVNVSDTTPPLITLLGSSNVDHELATTYTDAGATASDNIDGDISVNIILSGTVDSNTTGIYMLTYNASDSSGNAAAPLTRVVDVADRTAPIITITGANPLNHEIATVFLDPGATASDIIDGDITANIGVTGTVDAGTIGSYSLSYRVSDAAGNAAATAVRTVNVVDTGAPAITLIGSNPILHELQTVFTDPGATASDASDGDLTSSIVVTGNVDGNTAGTYTLSYDVTDSQSNAATTVTRDIIVADRTAPVITLTGSNPLNHEQGTAFTDPGATATDIINGDVSLNIVVTGTVDINTQGIYTLSYNVSDAAGNAATTITRDVVVVDTTIPVITLAGSNPLNHEVDTVFVDPGASASDNIDGDISGNIGVTGSVDASTLGTYFLNFNVTDSSGNTATTVTRTVNVVDTGAPSIALIGSNPILHELQTPFTDPGATASDAADGDVTASIIVTGTVDSNTAGTYTLSYDVVDSQSNAATTVTRDVIVADRTAPIITLTGSNPYTHEQGTVFTNPGATATDIIDGDVSLNIVATGTVDINTQGTYTLSYNVSDAAGNVATTITRDVIVVDTTIPVITLAGSNPLNHEVDTVFVDPGASASDNIDGDISGNIGITGSVDASTLGTYFLNFNVTDSSGNTAATVTRTVNVVDTGAPSIALIGSNPILHELQTPFTDPGATASDAADGDVTTSIIVTGTVDPNTAGTYTLSYDVVDSQSNAATTVTRDVIVADRTAPVITLTGSATLNHEQGTPYTDAGATATDIIDGNITASIVAAGAVNSAIAGSYVLTYNVSDAVGNAATQVTRTVTVVDTTIPVITLNGANPLNHEVNTLFTDPGATASDNIDGIITGNIGVTGTVDASVQGTYSLTYNVQDSSGNAATTVTRTVNVVDTGAPSIALIGDNPILHELSTPFTDPGATASDAADGDVTANIITTGSVNSTVAATYTLTYNVNDSQSNAAPTVTRDVIVADRTAPVITLTGSATLNHEQGTPYTDAGATASDIIDGDISINITVGGSVNTALAGTYVISYNVSDAAGNAATQMTRTITVVDTTIPVITLNGANPLNHEVNTLFTDPGATASDNIDGVITSNIGVTGTVDASVQGTYSLTYNVQDSSGNAATTVTRTVNVVDTGAPSIALIGNNPILHELATPFTDPGATASDAADGNITASIITTGSVNSALAGTYTLTYNVNDSQSNPAPTVTRDVIVADRTAPIITLTGAATMNIEQGSVYTESGATASDTIDGNVSASIIIGGAVNTSVAGTYILTYNVSDAAGNAATQVTRTVTVADQTAPVITLNGTSPIAHEVNTIFTDPGATATDNIDGDISNSIGVSGTVNAGAVGSYVLTYNVSDSSGNAAIAVTRTVNVTDTGAPVISVLGANPLNHELNTVYTDPGATASDAVDGNLTASIVTVNNVNANLTGSYTVTYDVSDSNSNAAATQIRTVNVGDFTAPVITLIGSANINVELGSSYSDAGATASDNIDGNLTSSIVTAGSVNPSAAGTYVISYDVTDAAGNSASQVTRTVVVSDTTAPVLTLLGSASINHEQGTAYSDPGASATDNTDGDITGSITVSGFVDATAAGTYVLSYNVSDLAGNNATTVTRTVIVQDTIIPTLTLLGANPLNHEQGTVFVDPGAAANDSVDGDISASVVATGSVNANAAATYTLTYNVSDTAGNNAIAITRSVIVADTTAPTITLTGLDTVNHEKGATYTDSGATGFDSVDGDISLSIVVNNTVNPNVSGTYTVFYDLTDAAGNVATTVTRSVIVADTIAPVIALTGPSTVNHSQGATYTDQGATASDNFDGDISSNIARTGTVDPNTPATYTLYYNVNDADGNPAATVTRTVIVADTTPPVITLTGNATVNVEQGSSYIDAGATATDDVDGNISGAVATSGDSVNPAISGTYIIRYDVSDIAGNAAAQVTRTVIVADTTIPVISLIGSTPLSHQQGTTYNDAGASANDNIDGAITANIQVTGSVNENVAGAYTLTYNVNDAAGNAAIAVTRTVNVADTQAPTITLVGASTINHEQGDVYTDAGATASDSVDGILTSSIATANNVNTAIAGSYTVTYDVSDAAGNVATQVIRTVNVADTTIPVITLSGSSTVDLTNGQIFIDPGYTATDNIDGTITGSVMISGSIDINTDGSYVLSYDVTDAGGNAATTVTRTVNVVTPSTVTIEAETASIGGSHTVATTNTGYLGSGYIEHSGEGYIEYTFNAYGVPYDLTVRYAWDTGDRPLEVILNSTSLGNLSFPATGTLTTWLDTATMTITPESGSNTIRLSTTGLSGANIDQLTLTPQ